MDYGKWNRQLYHSEWQLRRYRGLPNIFKAGGGKVKIPFDGTKITWIVFSFDKNKKTSSTSDASSTSSKCPNGYVASKNSVLTPIDALTLTGTTRFILTRFSQGYLLRLISAL